MLQGTKNESNISHKQHGLFGSSETHLSTHKWADLLGKGDILFDGSDIRRSPVEVKVVEIPVFTRGFYIHNRWLLMISEASTVCFSHFSGGHLSIKSQLMNPVRKRIGGSHLQQTSCQKNLSKEKLPNQLGQKSNRNSLFKKKRQPKKHHGFLINPNGPRHISLHPGVSPAGRSPPLATAPERPTKKKIIFTWFLVGHVLNSM